MLLCVCTKCQICKIQSVSIVKCMVCKVKYTMQYKQSKMQRVTSTLNLIWRCFFVLPSNICIRGIVCEKRNTQIPTMFLNCGVALMPWEQNWCIQSSVTHCGRRNHWHKASLLKRLNELLKQNLWEKSCNFVPFRSTAFWCKGLSELSCAMVDGMLGQPLR